MWRYVREWSVYLETDGLWSSLLARDVMQATSTVRNDSETQIVGAVLSFLTIAEDLDHTVANLGPDIMAWALAVR
jgi:hypothetical protein